MPIQRAAFKSVRKDKKRRARNLKVTSELKTVEKRFTSFINAKKQKEAQEASRALISKLDQASSKGIVHKNTASRKISRLMKALKKLEQGQ